MEWIVKDQKETEKLAKKLAQKLQGQEILAFFGGLGVGKTTFIRALCGALGVADEVTSPTYAMVHSYRGPVAVHHYDMYRVSSFEDLYSTGFFDALGTGVVVIEWSENIAEDLPQESIIVRIDRTNVEGERKICIEGILL